ncbi:MAG: diadenylate cyclase CdaA [Dehalococcoidia bacterium]|nr:diadenylate cyclase CdaA [Dehalococcoidia bacterium]
MPDLDHLREVLRQFGPTSIIDVLLIAAVIFASLRLLSGTRAITQMRGALTLILIVVVVGRIFDLTVVNFIVENSFGALLIGAAVVFQPEIRRALDRLGRTGIRGILNKEDFDEVIEAIAVASRRMSADRHGALIVIERQTGLQDVVDTGVAVDARISPELLTGIFFPNSPLHDMAVIVRGDRVAAAGCVLPLASELPESDRNLGTRHRAAIGVTEQTDAISVVVSEETGGISVAFDGELTHVADDRRLRAVLRTLTLGDAAPRREPARAAS